MLDGSLDGLARFARLLWTILTFGPGKSQRRRQRGAVYGRNEQYKDDWGVLVPPSDGPPLLAPHVILATPHPLL